MVARLAARLAVGWLNGGPRNIALAECTFVSTVKVSLIHVCYVSSTRPSKISESLDELSELVSSFFSPIPNRGVDPLPMIEEQPVGPNENGVSGPRRTADH